LTVGLSMLLSTGISTTLPVSVFALAEPASPRASAQTDPSGHQGTEQGEVQSPRRGDQGSEQGEVESPRAGYQGGDQTDTGAPRV
jgi:hypothetical protein